MTATVKKLATLDDLLNHSEEERLELLNGQIVERTMPRPKHGYPQRKTGAILDPFDNNGESGEPGGWWIITEVGVYYNEHNSCIHDIAGWRRKRLPELPNESFVTVLPDWICEIISPSNRKRDTIDKYKLFEQYHIPFYWIIDPDGEIILTFELVDGGYKKTNIVRSGDKVRLAPFEYIEIDVEIIFGKPD